MTTAYEARIATTYDAIACIEGFDSQDHTEQDVIDSFQLLIDSGMIPSLQGFYGRAAQALIDQGLCWAPYD